MTQTTTIKSIIFTFIATILTINAAPILINGSLEGPIANGSVPTGWTVLDPSPDTLDQNNNVGVNGLAGFGATPSASPDGGTWVGIGADNNFIEIFGQTVSGFDVGTTYNLSWYQANFGYAPLGYTGTNSVEALIDGNSIGTGNLSPLSTGWSNEVLQFVPTLTTHTLTFQLGSSTKSYLSIDGISLSEASSPVPEPSTYALFALGVGALGYMQRRRRNAVA